MCGGVDERPLPFGQGSVSVFVVFGGWVLLKRE